MIQIVICQKADFRFARSLILCTSHRSIQEIGRGEGALFHFLHVHTYTASLFSLEEEPSRTPKRSKRHPTVPYMYRT